MPDDKLNPNVQEDSGSSKSGAVTQETPGDWEQLRDFLTTTKGSLDEYKQKFKQIQEAKQRSVAAGSGGLFNKPQDLQAQDNFAAIQKGVADASGQVGQLQQLAQKYAPVAVRGITLGGSGGRQREEGGDEGDGAGE